MMFCLWSGKAGALLTLNFDFGGRSSSKIRVSVIKVLFFVATCSVLCAGSQIFLAQRFAVPSKASTGSSSLMH